MTSILRRGPAARRSAVLRLALTRGANRRAGVFQLHVERNILPLPGCFCRWNFHRPAGFKLAADGHPRPVPPYFRLVQHRPAAELLEVQLLPFPGGMPMPVSEHSRRHYRRRKWLRTGCSASSLPRCRNALRNAALGGELEAVRQQIASAPAAALGVVTIRTSPACSDRPRYRPQLPVRSASCRERSAPRCRDKVGCEGSLPHPPDGSGLDLGKIDDSLIHIEQVGARAVKCSAQLRPGLGNNCRPLFGSCWPRTRCCLSGVPAVRVDMLALNSDL